MKSVALEREKIRQRERERLARGREGRAARDRRSNTCRRSVEQFNLNKWLGQEEAREKLMQAGYRGQAPYVTFLFFRLVTPIVALAVTPFYVFVMLELDQPLTVKLGICCVAAYIGMQLA